MCSDILPIAWMMTQVFTDFMNSSRQLCENGVGLKLVNFGLKMFLLSRDISGIFESDQLGNAKDTLVREEEVIVLEDLDIAEKVLFIETKKAAQVLKVKNEVILVTFIF